MVWKGKGGEGETRASKVKKSRATWREEEKRVSESEERVDNVWKRTLKLIKNKRERV